MIKPIRYKLNAERRSVLEPSAGWGVVALVLLLAWAGCKPESPPPAQISPSGVYSLVSIDGKPVPCALTHDGATVTVKSGVYTFSGDGTCQSKTVFAIAEHNRDVNREVKATYTQDGATLTMRWEGAGMTTGTLAGDAFTMNNEGLIYVYRK